MAKCMLCPKTVDQRNFDRYGVCFDCFQLYGGSTCMYWPVTQANISKFGKFAVCNPPTQEANMDATRETAAGNPKAGQGAKKFSLRHLPLPAAIEVNRALEDGVRKYGAANWRITGVDASVYVDACMRHLLQWYDGSQERASDSGVHNLGHAMACLAILIDAQANGQLIDDRPAKCVDTDKLLLRGAQ